MREDSVVRKYFLYVFPFDGCNAEKKKLLKRAEENEEHAVM